MNILFICSRNKRRSLTAEAIFRNHGHHQIASAGTEESARRRVNHQLMEWADLVFVMEKRHKQKLVERFTDTLPDIIVLDIPDEYEYMDEELVAMLQDMVTTHL